MKKNYPAETYISEKTKNVFNVMTLFSVALGVNLCATGLAMKLDKEYSLLLIISGLFLSLGFLIYHYYKRIIGLNRTFEIKGFQIYNRDTKELVMTPGYQFSDRSYIQLKAAFSENQTIKSLWNMVGLAKTDYDPSNHIYPTRIKTDADDLFTELIEYNVLDVLSSALSTYFDSSKSKELIIIWPEDTIDTLLTNRFLNMFSGDPKKRKGFITGNGDNVTDPPNIRAMVRTGTYFAYYARFVLILPPKSTLRREGKSIVIDNPLFAVKVSSIFEGTSASIPEAFKCDYLGIPERSPDYSDLRFTVRIEVRFKFRAFFSKDKHDYLWIDDFIDSLNRTMSQEVFFEEIRWDTAQTVMFCQRVKELAAKKDSEKKDL